MHTIQFTSPNPLDHVCRVLDAMRKMGFHLEALQVSVAPDGFFRVLVVVETHDLLTIGTLLQRVASCIGVCDLTCEADGRVART